MKLVVLTAVTMIPGILLIINLLGYPCFKLFQNLSDDEVHGKKVAKFYLKRAADDSPLFHLDAAGSLTFRSKDFVNCSASAQKTQSVPAQIASEDLLAAKYLMTAPKASAKGI